MEPVYLANPWSFTYGWGQRSSFPLYPKKYGKPDLVFTEFTSVEGLCHGAERLLKEFIFDESQRPIIGQIYGTTPDFFRQSAILLAELGFDGVDINMGCPAKNVAHSGAGAALILTPDLAQNIVRAVQQGLREWENGATVFDCVDLTPNIKDLVAERKSKLPAQYQVPRPLPVSIKTRIGFHADVVSEWIPRLLETEPAAITVHGRTLKQQYGGQANWEAIGNAATLAHSTKTLILGNGDVSNREDALDKIQHHHLAGALLGRATMGNPYVFQPADYTQPRTRFEIALEHSYFYEKCFNQEERYSFMPMRKHLGWYVREIPNASQVRIELFQANTSDEVAAILRRHQLITML